MRNEFELLTLTYANCRNRCKLANCHSFSSPYSTRLVHCSRFRREIRMHKECLSKFPNHFAIVFHLSRQIISLSIAIKDSSSAHSTMLQSPSWRNDQSHETPLEKCFSPSPPKVLI